MSQYIIANLEYAIKVIEAAPQELFDLSAYTIKTERGTLACTAGWLALDPNFSAMVADGIPGQRFTAARLAHNEELFGDKSFRRLFGPRMNSDNDIILLRPTTLPDKQLAIARLKHRIVELEKTP